MRSVYKRTSVKIEGGENGQRLNINGQLSPADRRPSNIRSALSASRIPHPALRGLLGLSSCKSLPNPFLPSSPGARAPHNSSKQKTTRREENDMKHGISKMIVAAAFAGFLMASLFKYHVSMFTKSLSTFSPRPLKSTKRFRTRNRIYESNPCFLPRGSG